MKRIIAAAAISFVMSISSPAADLTLDQTVDYIRDVLENQCNPVTLRLKSHKYNLLLFDFSVPGINGQAQVSVRLDQIDSAGIHKVKNWWGVIFNGSPNPVSITAYESSNASTIGGDVPGFPAFCNSKDTAERLARAFEHAATLAKSAPKDPFANKNH